MRTMMLGIKDYIKDCWQKNEGYFTKEGNLWHYIQQRKIAKGVKNGYH